MNETSPKRNERLKQSCKVLLPEPIDASRLYSNRVSSNRTGRAPFATTVYTTHRASASRAPPRAARSQIHRVGLSLPSVQFVHRHLPSRHR